MHVNQKLIVSGFLVFGAAHLLDYLLIRYSAVLFISGSLVSGIGLLLWLWKKENRSRVRAIFPKSSQTFSERLRQMFDFSWSRLSVLWSAIAFFYMIIVHISAVTMKTGAYDAAVDTIRNDELIQMQLGEVKGLSYIVTGKATTHGTSTLHFGVIGSRQRVRVEAIVEGADGIYQTTSVALQDQ